MRKVINYRIQWLRGIAFIMIFVSYCSLIVNNQGENILKWFGAFGVELFIILSGYLAFESYPNSVNFMQYYKKKISRFYPLHIITLGFALPFCLPMKIKTIGKVLLNLSLLQVWFPFDGIYFSLNAVSWYLGVTVFFIVMTPYLIKNVSCMSNEFLIVFLGGIQIVQVLLVYIAKIFPLDEHWVTYIFSVSRSFDCVWGIFCF